MKLDFTAIRGNLTEKPTEVQNSPILSSLDNNDTIIAINLKKPLERLAGGNTGEQAAQLKRLYDTEQVDHEKTLELYREYQNNIKQSEQLQTEILKDIKAGTGVYILFLKAVKAISLMTSNKVFYNQIEEDIKAIYGAGLQEREPLEIELKEVEERVERIKEAQIQETNLDTIRRLTVAIEKHTERVTVLKGKIGSSKL